MDGCLDLTPVKIPRPQIYTHVDLAIMERKEKVPWCCVDVTLSVSKYRVGLHLF